jgi:hypothetical protein
MSMENTHHLNAHIPTAIYHQLQTYARRNHLTITDATIFLLGHALAHMEQSKPDKSKPDDLVQTYNLRTQEDMDAAVAFLTGRGPRPHWLKGSGR